MPVEWLPVLSVLTMLVSVVSAVLSAVIVWRVEHFKARTATDLEQLKADLHVAMHRREVKFEREMTAVASLEPVLMKAWMAVLMAVAHPSRPESLKARDAWQEFSDYVTANKVFFPKELVEQLGTLQGKIFGSFVAGDSAFWPVEPEKREEALRVLSEEVPPLHREIEDAIRALLTP